MGKGLRVVGTPVRKVDGLAKCTGQVRLRRTSCSASETSHASRRRRSKVDRKKGVDRHNSRP